MSNEQTAVIIQKVPFDDFDMSIDWSCSGALGTGETVTDSTWSVNGADNALTLTNPQIVTPASVITTIDLNGGTIGNYYVVVNSVTTSGGRKFSRCFLVQVVPFIYVSQSRCL